MNVSMFSRKFWPVSISVLGEIKQVNLSVISKKIISDETRGKINNLNVSFGFIEQVLPSTKDACFATAVETLQQIR